MLGKHHVIINTTGCAVLGSWGWYAVSHHVPYAEALARQIYTFMTPYDASIVLTLPALVLGSYLPDIDNRNSRISRFLRFHLGGPHRGSTHTVWHILLWLAISIFCEPLRWCMGIALGVTGHLIADSLSNGGIAPLYPLGRYRTYQFPDGHYAIAPLTKKYPRLYRVGQPSETRVLIAWVIVHIVLCAIPWLFHHFMFSGR